MLYALWVYWNTNKEALVIKLLTCGVPERPYEGSWVEIRWETPHIERFISLLNAFINLTCHVQDLNRSCSGRLPSYLASSSSPTSPTSPRCWRPSSRFSWSWWFFKYFFLGVKLSTNSITYQVYSNTLSFNHSHFYHSILCNKNATINQFEIA